jgi:hypothetical protein
MRHWAVLLLALAVGCTAGQPLDSTSWLQPFRPFQGLSGIDVITLETALVEGPVGDRYIDQDLWALADDQVVALDRKALLHDNGFRVGQIGGLTPSGLQKLLTSERTCLNPRRIQLHAGNSTRLALGPTLAASRFELQQDERKVPVQLEQADCALIVIPTLTPDGRTRLHFTPEIQHGKSAFLPQSADRSTWILQKLQPTETYQSLAWDVTLAPNEYVVVGGCYDRVHTLGHQCFIRTEETTPRQRLLVIRTSRPAVGLTNDASVAADDDSPARQAPPLALQAAGSRVRGTAP